MIWAVLIALGVPLWLCACGILTLVFRNRSLRKRPGNVPCKFRPADKKRWTSGHGVWVSDVFAWGGSAAAWKSELAWTTGLATRPADDGERKKLRRLGDSPLIASLALAEGGRSRSPPAASTALAFSGHSRTAWAATPASQAETHGRRAGALLG